MLLATPWRHNTLGAKWRCKNVVSSQRVRHLRLRHHFPRRTNFGYRSVSNGRIENSFKQVLSHWKVCLFMLKITKIALYDHQKCTKWHTKSEVNVSAENRNNFATLSMERRFNIYSIIWRYLQIFGDIFKYLKISSNIWRYLQIN